MAAYAELHCHTNFSFLDGASHPEELAEEAHRLGSRRARGHRPRRPLRRGPVRGRGPPARPADGLRRRAHPGRGQGPGRGGRSRRASTCSSSPKARRVRRAGARDQRGADAGREERAPATRSPTWRPRPGATAWWVLTGCRKGAVAGRARCATARPRPSARCDRLVDGFGRDRVLVELWDHGDPLDRPRNDALARLAARAGRRGGGHEQRPLRHARPAPARDRARGGPQPAQPRRARRLAAGHAVRAPAQPGRAAPALRPLPGRGRARGRDRGRVRVRPPGRGAEPARLPGAGRAHRHELAARAHRGAARRSHYPSTHPQHAQGDAPDRVRARRDRAARLPRLLPAAPRHRRLLPHPRHLLPGAGERGEQRGLLRARRHQGRRGRARPPVRAVPLAPSATARPTSTSTSSTSAARR